MSAKTILVIGTADTKSDEIDFLRQQVQAQGAQALVMDVGVLDRGHAAIAEATGVAPAVHRPPYGIYSPPGLRLVREGGWTPLLWSRWGHDWARRATPASIARDVTEQLDAGDVLLLHDADDYSVPGCWRATAAALPEILGRIAARGLNTVTAGSL